MRYVIGILFLTSPAFAGEPVYSWRTRPDDPDRTYLYQDGKQVGGWCYKDKRYRAFDGKDWGPPTTTAPTQPPANRVVIVMPPVQTPLVMQPSAPVPRLRGPVRNRLGTAMGEIMVDQSIRVMEQIPGAILDSILKGQFELKGRVEIK